MQTNSEDFSIYVVEDENSVRASLCALLSTHSYRTIPCESAEAFLEVYDADVKACIVLDLRLPGMDGIELQAHLNDIDANAQIIILTAHGDVPNAVQALRAGAVDFIEKPAQIEQLLSAIEITKGTFFNQARPVVPPQVVKERLSKLTSREHEVLKYLLEGNLNKEIANKLDLSLRTVEVHRARIREKMHARGVADLIRMIG